jgi:hypothetical protein
MQCGALTAFGARRWIRDGSLRVSITSMPAVSASMRSSLAIGLPLAPAPQGRQAEFGDTGADAGRGLTLRMD